MTGKQRCEFLKQVRREIARANDIPVEERVCTHQGECAGTCPRCESELRALAAQLEKRRRLRKRVALAGVSVAMAAALSGCVAGNDPGNTAPPSELSGMVAIETPAPENDPIELSGEVEILGDLQENPENGATP